jgi:hypothetical protein
MDRGRWSRLQPPETLSVTLKKGRLSVERERFEVNP